MEMGEESCNTTPPRSSLSLRFLGLLKQPSAHSDLDPNLFTSSSSSSSPLELHESDVVWSESSPSSVSSSSPLSTSPLPLRRTSRAFLPPAFGLSALLDSTSPSPITPPVSVPITRPSAQSRKAFHQSAPMAVPVWPGRRREERTKDDMWGLEEEEEEEEDEDESEMERIGDDETEEMVPPHVIVARSHMTSFSVLEGAGRTLKGRDLRRVRNAVLQKTGFLDV